MKATTTSKLKVKDLDAAKANAEVLEEDFIVQHKAAELRQYYHFKCTKCNTKIFLKKTTIQRPECPNTDCLAIHKIIISYPPKKGVQGHDTLLTTSFDPKPLELSDEIIKPIITSYFTKYAWEDYPSEILSDERLTARIEMNKDLLLTNPNLQLRTLVSDLVEQSKRD